MRRLLPFFVFVLFVSACSSDEQVLVDGGAAAAPASVGDADDTSGSVSNADGPEEISAPTTTILETAAPKTAIPETTVLETRTVGLAPEDVLLGEDALGLPWELTSRRFDGLTFDIGDEPGYCSDRWLVDRMVGLTTASASWWRDGANLNHQVGSFDDPDYIEAAMDAAGRIVDSCPVLVWAEGGEDTHSEVDLGVDVAGVETVAVLTDEGFGQQSWLVVSNRENLISVLTIPTWESKAPPVEMSEVAKVATLVAQRLAAAEPRPLAEPESSVAPEPTVPPTTTTAPEPVTTPPNVERTLPDPGTDTVSDSGLPEDLVALLLDEGELDDDWFVGDPSRYAPNPIPVGDLVECPELAAVDAIDALLEVERSSGWVDVNDVMQRVGRAPDATAAARLVSGFLEVEPCMQRMLNDETAGFDEGELTLPGENSVTIDEVSIEGASAAAKMFVAIDGERFALVILAVDEVVTVLSFEGQSLALRDISLDVAAKAANKIAAVG